VTEKLAAVYRDLLHLDKFQMTRQVSLFSVITINPEGQYWLNICCEYVNTKPTIMKKLLFSVLLIAALASCNKKDSDEKYIGKDPCFDSQLYEQHKNDICPDNCPGVIGCDGKTYCNSCYAVRLGIKVNP
jgi:hypothetical protein